jgi:hypothetical protein
MSLGDMTANFIMSLDSVDFGLQDRYDLARYARLAKYKYLRI